LSVCLFAAQRVAAFASYPRPHTNPPQIHPALEGRHERQKKNILIWYVICILFVFSAIQADATQKSEIATQTFVSASYVNKPLGEVLQDIIVQTGYNFVIPEEWLSLTISGEFSHVALEKFFHHILKNKNFALLINEKEKLITGREFEGGSRYLYLTDTSGVKQDIDPYSGMLMKELQELHAHQLRENQLRKVNPESVDPVSGLTNGYLAKLHKTQIDQKEMARKEADAVDPMSGLPLDELERLHEHQLTLKEKAGALEPMTGIPLGELQRLHEQQLANSETR